MGTRLILTDITNGTDKEYIGSNYNTIQMD